MQANVQKILDAATATDSFELVGDRVFDENEKYPALIVTERSDEPVETTSVQNVYFSRWTYQVHILQKFGAGYANLEGLTSAFLKELLKGEWRLVRQRHFEALISGRDILVNSLELEFIGKAAYV